MIKNKKTSLTKHTANAVASGFFFRFRYSQIYYLSATLFLLYLVQFHFDIFFPLFSTVQSLLIFYSLLISASVLSLKLRIYTVNSH